jgi:ribosome-binding factor A
MSVRTERVASVLKEELGTYFQREFPLSQYGLITVTEVRISPDLREAKVYVSVFGPPDRKKKAFARIEGQKASIRSAMGQAVHLRFTPDLTFFLDDTLDRAMTMETLFKEIHEKDEEHPKPDGA